ncbi:hypothetical protein RIF29_36330 [Crotalaria pallida]|uniref:Uncharacterized protein n=1 Tax=Crotalaria pallida TaxID=3830 RepID=A0AAN9EAZ0_CROPI
MGLVVKKLVINMQNTSKHRRKTKQPTVPLILGLKFELIEAEEEEDKHILVSESPVKYIKDASYKIWHYVSWTYINGVLPQPMVLKQGQSSPDCRRGVIIRNNRITVRRVYLRVLAWSRPEHEVNFEEE